MFFVFIITVLVTGTADLNQDEVSDNILPIADAGEDMDVVEGEFVIIDGSGSSDPDGFIPSFIWTQKEGMPVMVNNSIGATAYFNAPPAENDTILIFELNVKDNDDIPDSDHILVTVKSLSENGGNLKYQAADKIALGPRPEGVTATLDYAYFIDSTYIMIFWSLKFRIIMKK